MREKQHGDVIAWRHRAPGMALVAALTLAATLPGAAALAAEQGVPAAAAAGHEPHQMSAGDLATLRRKIPLYQQYTDEQINAGMSRMVDSEAYISTPAVTNRVGVLALGHGYGEPGNSMFKAAYGKVGTVYPTAAGLGMAMMNSSHIQAAIDELQKAGAQTIVALPTEIGDDTSLIRQWHYIFGLMNDSAYLDVPRVKSKARILVAMTPTTSPLVADILADYAKGASKDPAKEAVILMAHGPEESADNDKLLRILAGHAAKVQAATSISVVHYDSLQDDAPTAMRAANVQRMRDWVQKEMAGGKRVIVLQVIMTGQGGVTRRIRQDLNGLDVELVDKGLAEHPLFNRWIEATVAAELKKAG